MLTAEDDEYVRQDFGQEYMDLLMRNMGFDFDLNRTSRERELCFEACDKTCGDGSTAYGAVTAAVAAFGAPGRGMAAAIAVGIGILDYSCRAKCKNGWGCR